ncbi:hypothetical protein AQUSIP_14860 [Aquicella siphonis]|uniref:Uncharacterized protein n=1 Tax=Aquicella siphonis TaxID=254247 RepID=A0A5E4PGL7_9COXI|nr:hypothetical protein AQUSIP_14860 [Aquicella siphonis]
MEQDDKNKLTFTAKGAALGLAAYVVLILIVAAIFLFG